MNCAVEHWRAIAPAVRWSGDLAGGDLDEDVDYVWCVLIGAEDDHVGFVYYGQFGCCSRGLETLP